MAIASLALAIGCSTAAFSVLDAYSLRELPVRDPKSLTWLGVKTREQRADDFSWPEFEAIAPAHSFSGIASQSRHGPRVKLPDRDDFPITSLVSDNFFDLLGVRAVRGEVFHTNSGRDGTVVLSYRYWTSALGSDPAIIGRTLPVGTSLLKIIAVLPPGFTGPNRGLAVDLFVSPQAYFGTMAFGFPNNIHKTDYELLGRLRPGVTLESARAEIDSILRRLESEGREPAPQRRTTLDLFTSGGIWDKLKANGVLVGIVVLLILIAAANLANLRLVDNERRRREVAIRLALGAGRTALARQHLAETLLLSALGTGAGLLLATWLIHAAPAMLANGKSYVDYNIHLDARTFLFSSFALLAVALAGTFIPLTDAWRRRGTATVHGTRSTSSSCWLAALVITQMALVTGVTCTAGLLWRSLSNIAAIRPAMDPDRSLLLVQGWWEDQKTPAIRTEEAAEATAAVPGVQRVAWARRALLSPSLGGATVSLEMPGEPKLSFYFNQVSPNYFAATGARVLRGRSFGTESTLAVMVNETFVRRFMNGREPLGQWIHVAGKDRQIVGVTEDGPTLHLREKIQPYFYFPFDQMPDTELTFFVECRKNPASVADSVRAVLRQKAKGFTAVHMQTMRTFMRATRSDEQFAAEIAGGLTLLGLVVAAAGLFGVSLFAVARRTPEFGIRVAVGATPLRLALQVLREAAYRIAIALPIGWALAYSARTSVQKLLFGVASDDPWTFLLAGTLVAVVGCLAALHPALRAARVDPMVALRHE